MGNAHMLYYSGGYKMDVPRKIGIGIVMIVPTFVGAGALWSIFHSWPVSIVWLVIMAGLASSIIRKKTVC